MIKAYCLKTKEKNVPMHDAVITRTARGGYIANGNDGKGNKMAAILSEAKAKQAIEDGVAKKRVLTLQKIIFNKGCKQQPLLLFSFDPRICFKNYE